MKIFAVCDSELNYARRLSEKLARICGEELFLTQLFDSPEAVLEYHKKTRVDALLLGDKVRIKSATNFLETLDVFEREGIDKIFILSSKEQQDKSLKGYKSFYKYQAVTSLINDIRQAYMQAESSRLVKKSGVGTKPVVIGVFAPVNCVEKTIWALLAGMLLAREREVLYLNLERYAGFDAILGRCHDGDLSEVFYHILHGGEAEITQIKEIIQSFRGLSYVPPIRFGRELSDVPGAVVLSCVEGIIGLAKEGRLSERVIILDFSGSAETHFEICKMCDRVFLVQRNDCITKATVNSFLEECGLLSESEVTDRICRVDTPVLKELPKDRFLELNLEGELGEKTKQVLQGEGLFEGRT